MIKTTAEDYLGLFLAQHGEGSWRAEVQRLVLAALQTKSEKHEAFWRELTKDYDWLDWDSLMQQAQTPPTAERLIAETLKSQMPGIKSQAQYDAVVGAMEAMRILINAILEGSGLRQPREALEMSFIAIGKATELTLKLEEAPEAAQSEASQQFKGPPAQFGEVEIQAQLLQELAITGDITTLDMWYASSKDLRDKIKTQSLRNTLMDAIRAKRNSLVS